MRWQIFAIFFSTASLLFSNETTSKTDQKSGEAQNTTIISKVDEASEETQDMKKVSEAFGHLIGKNIETIGIKFDLSAVLKGIQDSANGKNSPMSDVECVQAIAAVQETTFKLQAQDNLKQAEEFLVTNGKQKGIVALEEGKIQYKVEKPGKGATVTAHFSPLIRYVGKYLDGTVFGSSKEDEMITLDESIPGFSKGLLGMKEGEKRVLFIHPDYGYGTSGHLPPNSLLTFEVELIKANAPTHGEETLSITPHGKSKLSHEIAGPDLDKEVMR